MTRPGLRAQLAIANATVVVALVMVVTVLVTSRSDDLSRAEAVTGSQRDAEVLASQVAPHIGDPSDLRALLSPTRSRRTEVVSPAGVRLAGADLTSDAPIANAVAADLNDSGVNASHPLASRFDEAVGVDPVVVGNEVRGAAIVTEPLPPRRGWRQLYGLDVPAAVCLALLASVLGWWLAGRIAGPLDRLAEQARELVLSGRALPAPETDIPEIATLSAAMSRLSDRVSRDVDQRTWIDAHLRRVSHELRTPLTTIRLRVEALPDHDADPSVEVILGQLDRLDQLGSELAHLRSEPRETSPVDVSALAEESVARLRPLAASAHVDLRARTQPDCVVDGETDALRDAIVNLIENAIKFTPSGGSGSVTVRRADDQVWVEVSDTGPGIAAQLADAVIRPGVRVVVAGRPPGSGQGLAIVAATVDRHGGTLELATAPGGGALVRLRLPSHPA